MNAQPSRKFFLVGMCAACSLVCVLASVNLGFSKPVSGKRSLTLPKNIVTQWQVVPARPELPPLLPCDVALTGKWSPRFALLLPAPAKTDARTMAMAQQILPYDVTAVTPATVEKWIAAALKRTRALEKERDLAQKKEEEAERAKANAAYVPPTTPQLSAALAATPVPPAAPPATQLAAPAPQAPATPGAKAASTGQPTPAAPASAAFQQAPIAKAPASPQPSTAGTLTPPVATAPATAPATTGSFNQAVVSKAPETKAPTGKAPDVKAPDVKAADAKAPNTKTPDASAQAAKTPPPAPAAPGSFAKAPVAPAGGSPDAAAPAPGKAPGKEVAALTPPPSPGASAATAKPATSTSKPAAGKQTQDPAVLATPEGKQAHESFKPFCMQFVKKIESSYDKGTTGNVKVEKRGGKFVAQFMDVDDNSVELLVKSSGYDHTPFVGVLQYSEQLFEAEGDTAQAAKAGAFKMVNSVKVRELFRYANKKWQF